MKWPIFIPSKGRPNAKLFQMIPEAVLVIEPQDRKPYAEVENKKLVMLENNQGIAYVRQFILDHCREFGIEWYWMLDDDISAFYGTHQKKLQPISAQEALKNAQAFILSQQNIGQAALEYAQFAWSQEKSVKLYGYCDVAVAINTGLTKFVNYRPEMNLKEDRDFTLQILASGARTMRCSMLSFRTPKNGANKGGLQGIYAQQGREEATVDRMCAAWPGIVTKQLKPDGRIDCKIDWKFFKK